MDDLYYKQFEPFWGSWRIVDSLGEGSFGKCYKIEKKDISGSYYAAMKVITVPQNKDHIKSVRSTGMSEDNVSVYFQEIARDISKEFKLMEQLKGTSNIVSYEDHEIRDHQDGIGCDIFIRMELLTPIDEYFTQNAPSEQDIIKLGIDICKALEVCGNKNIIHRDIKPANIFISPNNDFKLGDFGVARTIEASCGEFSKKGTYDYMAPEVYRDATYDMRADLFSLGIVLYKLMNHGRIPFLPPAPQKISYSDLENAIAERMRNAVPQPPAKASAGFAAVIIKACQSEVEKRYTSATEMRKDLERLCGIQSPVMPFVNPADDSGTVILTRGQDSTGTVMMNANDDNATVVMPVNNLKSAGIGNVKISPANNNKPKKAGGVVKTVVIILLILLLLAGGGLAALKFIGENNRNNDDTDETPEVIEELTNSEWVLEGYEEEYPFYGIETEYVDGEKTENTRVNTEITKYPAESTKFFVKEDKETGELTRILYIDGQPTEFTETIEELGEEEWLIEWYTEDFREYARLYVNGEKTASTEYTGVIYPHDYFLKMDSNGKWYKYVYVNGAPSEATEIPALEEDAWVVSGSLYNPDTFEELAVHYVNGEPLDETKATGVVYEPFWYTFLDADKNQYYRMLYVNGYRSEETEYIEMLSDDEWLVESHDTSYREYARHYINREPTSETKYTGYIVSIVEWKKETVGSYRQERKYVNGVKTDEIRNKKKIKSNSNKTNTQQSTQTNQNTGTVQTPTTSTSSATTVTPTVDNVVASVKRYSDGEFSSYTDSYNAAGKLIKREHKVLDLDAIKWVISTYDGNGNLIGQKSTPATVVTDRDGNIVAR